MYTAQGKINQQEVLQQYLPMVRRQALGLKTRLPSNIELDDLIQAGSSGLLDAMTRYLQDWPPRLVPAGYPERSRADGGSAEVARDVDHEGCPHPASSGTSTAVPRFRAWPRKNNRCAGSVVSTSMSTTPRTRPPMPRTNAAPTPTSVV